MIDVCSNGCTQAVEGEQQPVQVRAPRVLCGDCVGRLERWLDDVVDLWDDVADFVLPGSTATVAEGDERRASSREHSPALVRLVVVDLLDSRLGRKWHGTAPAAERRGALGTLLPLADELAEVLGQDPRTGGRHVVGEARFLLAHVDTLVQQDWAGGDVGAYAEIERLRADIGTAIGEVRLRSLGKCSVVLQTEEGTSTCGGRLTQRPQSMSVRCSKCRTTWDTADLERLGLVLGAA